MLASYHEVILHMTQEKVKAKKLCIGNILGNQIVELQVYTEKKGTECNRKHECSKWFLLWLFCDFLKNFK